MTRYSDHREQNVEIKQFHKVWSRLDSRIELPERLSGEALLPLLENISVPKPVSRQIRFSPKVFTWKSGITYAAAFVLILALSALLGRGTPHLREGSIPVETPPNNESQPPDRTIRPMDNEEAEQTPAQAQNDGVAVSKGESAPGEQASQPGDASAFSTVSAEGQQEDEPLGVGGQSWSILLGEDGMYSYTYRQNDATDPDKQGYPITVNILHTSTGVLAFEIDIPDMDRIQAHFVHEGTVTFIGGSDGQGGVTLRTYDITSVREPREMGALTQPGRYLDARLHKEVVGLFTYTDDTPDCEVIPLPDSAEEGFCVVTLLDVLTMEWEQKAFSGAGDDLRLYNLHAYLQYQGAPAEEGDQGPYVAQIRLDGLSIELRNDESVFPAEGEGN